jgi:hypothetical protein
MSRSSGGPRPARGSPPAKGAAKGARPTKGAPPTEGARAAGTPPETGSRRVTGPPLGNGPTGDPDFAEEHTSPTFADQMAGGPEGIRESESPRGLAGMDQQRWPRRRWWSAVTRAARWAARWAGRVWRRVRRRGGPAATASEVRRRERRRT